MPQHLHLRAAASGSALGRAGRGAREATRGAAGEPGARQAELPGARSALAAPPLAALSPPKPVKKIHQLHDRAPLKGARRHLVGVISGRRRERAGWVRVTLPAAAGGGPPAPVARTKRPCRPRLPHRDTWGSPRLAGRGYPPRKPRVAPARGRAARESRVVRGGRAGVGGWPQPQRQRGEGEKGRGRRRLTGVM